MSMNPLSLGHLQSEDFLGSASLIAGITEDYFNLMGERNP